MMRALGNDRNSGAQRRILGNARGFTLVEMLVVVVVGTILTVMAIPSVTSGVRTYRLRGAIANVTWAIHSTRYQALMEGYPFQVVFSSTANTYQIQSSPANNGTFTNLGTSVPFSSYPVVLSADTSLSFKPNGYVTPAVGTLTFNIAYQGVCQKLSVTNYGNVSITPSNPQPTCP